MFEKIVFVFIRFFLSKSTIVRNLKKVFSLCALNESTFPSDILGEKCG